MQFDWLKSDKMGVGVIFVELLVAASADWLKNDTTMVMVVEEIDIAKLFALRWECFCMPYDYKFLVSLLE